MTGASGGWRTLAGEESDDELEHEGNGEAENGHELTPAAQQDTSAVYHDTASPPVPVPAAEAAPALNVVAPSPAATFHAPAHPAPSSNLSEGTTTTKPPLQNPTASPVHAASLDESLNSHRVTASRQHSMPGSFVDDTESERSVEVPASAVRPASPAAAPSGSRSSSPAPGGSAFGFAARMKRLVIG